MGKIVFWVVVVFVVLFALRLASLAKQKARREAESRERKAIPPAQPTVRCVECGMFVPKSESLPVPTGYRCAEPGCARRR